MSEDCGGSSGGAKLPAPLLTVSQLPAVASSASLRLVLDGPRMASQLSFSSVSELKTNCEGDVDCGAADTYVVGEYHLTACPICLEPFTLDNPAIVVHCEHGFHLQCLESWRQRSPVCPVCQMSLTGDTGHIMSERNARRRRRYRAPALYAAAAVAMPAPDPEPSPAVATGARDAKEGDRRLSGEESASEDAQERATAVQEYSRLASFLHWVSSWCSRG